jgi:hypothetical protein
MKMSLFKSIVTIQDCRCLVSAAITGLRDVEILVFIPKRRGQSVTASWPIIWAGPDRVLCKLHVDSAQFPAHANKRHIMEFVLRSLHYTKHVNFDNRNASKELLRIYQ